MHLAHPRIRHLAWVVVALLPLSAFAQAPPEPGPGTSARTSTKTTTSANQSSQEVLSDERLAREWGLRTEEWQRYKEVMQGPLGVYAPHLDPLTALGIEARSDQEQRRYAELQVRAEAQRVGKTLAYQRAYDAAWKRLHPDMQPVNLTAAETGAPVRRTAAATLPGATETPGGRLAVFVKAEACAACDERVRQLQTAGTAFDVYVVGSRHEDARIRSWAARAGIDPAKVRSQQITLNHDAGRWISFGAQGELPAVLRQVDGQWQRL